jgi:hypothetical protein
MEEVAVTQGETEGEIVRGPLEGALLGGAVREADLDTLEGGRTFGVLEGLVPALIWFSLAVAAIFVFFWLAGAAL